MTIRDAFGLFVRIVALLIVLYGAYNILFAAMEATGLFGKSTYPLYQHIIGGLVFIGFGVAILRLADWVTAFAYPLRESASRGVKDVDS